MGTKSLRAVASHYPLFSAEREVSVDDTFTHDEVIKH